MATPSSRATSDLRNRRAAEIEGDGVEVDAPRLVADAGRPLDLIDRVETLDTLDRRFAEELIVLVRAVHPPGIEDVVLDRHGQLHRSQVETRIAPVADPVVIAVVHIGQHIFPAIRHDARAPDHIAILIADGDDLHAVFAHDHLADATARQVLIVDLARTAAQAGPLVTFDKDISAEADDCAAFIGFADHLGALRPLALAGLRRTLAARALLARHRHDFCRLGGFRCRAVIRRRRTGRLGRYGWPRLFLCRLLATTLAVARTRLLAVEHRRSRTLGRHGRAGLCRLLGCRACRSRSCWSRDCRFCGRGRGRSRRCGLL